MKIIAVIIFMTVTATTGSYGQTKKHSSHPVKTKTHAAANKQTKEPKAMPTWAAAHHYSATEHAYFPDYYTYYDPARGGYVYWENGKYTFTPTVPPFLDKVDLSASRVELIKGLSLDLHPEQNYPRYMKLYPAQPGTDGKVPVPHVGE